ncbi:MAG: L,D-transpeptidase [Alphaproteobacteria bacterium]|nr:L,D-transpeptidase [Alphaproteobacteria bacterium]
MTFTAILLTAPMHAIAAPADGYWGELAEKNKAERSKKRSFGTGYGYATGKNNDYDSTSYGKKTAKKSYSKSPDVMSGGAKPYIAPQKPSVVNFKAGYDSGAIVIDTAGRRLYYVLSNGRAYSYPIAVGKPGFSWTGVKQISSKKDWPDWHPPAEMRKRKPDLPKLMTGGLNNPLGAKALYLGSTLYRIHGTNNLSSIGTASSSGCFRMSNNHVAHLSKIAGVGTKVHVVRSLGKGYAKTSKPKSKNYSKNAAGGSNG